MLHCAILWSSQSNIRASNVLLYNSSIQISLHQTSAALSPMFWFQPRPPPRWPVANGRRITKAVTLENTINTLNFYCWCHQYFCLWCHQYYCRVFIVIRITVGSLPTSLLISSRRQTKLRKLPPGLCGNWTWADFTNLLWNSTSDYERRLLPIYWQQGQPPWREGWQNSGTACHDIDFIIILIIKHCRSVDPPNSLADYISMILMIYTFRWNKKSLLNTFYQHQGYRNYSPKLSHQNHRQNETCIGFYVKFKKNPK